MRGREASRQASHHETLGKQRLPLTVVKVGGSLLRDEADLTRAASAVAERRQRGESLLVVASALKGVTDILDRASLRALDPRRTRGELKRILERLRHRHEEIARSLADRTALSQIEDIFKEIDRLLESLRGAGGLVESTYARLLSAGERLSVPLLAAAIRAQGHDSRSTTAEEMGIVAKGAPCRGSCDLDGSREGLLKVRPHLRDRVLVLTGFYGIDRRGHVTLFGRGGTDDTACAVAAGLDAAYLELWKDVLGFMSADPHTVESARLVDELSFDEVAKLGAYGTGIVHYGCLEPLRGRPTQIFICSIRGRFSSGTRLIEQRRRRSAKVIAVAARKGWAEFRLRCDSAGDRALTGKVLRSLGEAQVHVRTISGPSKTLSFTIHDTDIGRTQDALRSMKDRRPHEFRCHPSLVGAVGDGVATDSGISSRMLDCLFASGIDCDRVALPSGHAGLSCAVPPEDLTPALHRLHEHFIAPVGG